MKCFFCLTKAELFVNKNFVEATFFDKNGLSFNGSGFFMYSPIAIFVFIIFRNLLSVR